MGLVTNPKNYMQIKNDCSRRHFITTSLAAASAAAWIGNGASARAQLVPVAPSSANNDWEKTAKSTYENLKTVFQQSRTYWQLGQTFDTIIDYFIVTNSIEEASAFSKVALDRYAVSRGSWYDDYAWWAIANLKAAQHKELFGDDHRYVLQEQPRMLGKDGSLDDGLGTCADKPEVFSHSNQRLPVVRGTMDTTQQIPEPIIH